LTIKLLEHENVNLVSSPSSDYTFLIDSYNEDGQKKYITLLPGQELTTSCEFNN